jgi:alkylation response protein AidB-like acyl-CoA dehydrogenase
VRPIVQINGSTGFCEEFLDDVVVTDEEIIGEVNEGWSVAQTMLVYERGAGESGASPVEPRVLAPDLVALARNTGRADDPVVRQAIARAHINDYAQYHLGRRVAARLRSSATPDPAVAAYGKLASGTMSPLRAQIAVEVGGGAALVWEHDNKPEMQTAINYLNGRMTSIAAGTNEMQRNGIGERVLGLPREPSFDSNKPFSEVIRDARNWSGKVN